ncbi:DUF488 domain-containing protein [Paludisphaera borealis]|uniref:DUF488 domain-containing protein n=1 Tax=Paludisphaera borealis TaxID=1387353 RepID=A0A1U7CJ79_9BACT|nr:DUF488 domain-containing protein [Paludisphaera borealis]APW58989.1 hypothetical protein BSF38_00402 [Paludisphaera borealis]
MFKLKRVYEQTSPDDGFRVLVERLWPRGVSKERAELDLWLKDVAPSPELRKWFSHDPAKWREFQERYAAELKDDEAALDVLKQKGKEGTVTLLYASHDEEHNGALVLKTYLDRHHTK